MLYWVTILKLKTLPFICCHFFIFDSVEFDILFLFKISEHIRNFFDEICQKYVLFKK